MAAERTTYCFVADDVQAWRVYGILDLEEAGWLHCSEARGIHMYGMMTGSGRQRGRWGRPTFIC
jgi:hypothetical protein